MPLVKGKSPESFTHNLKAEMHAGKPQKQALAIAYAMKRKAQHKAFGGKIEHEEDTGYNHVPTMRMKDYEEYQELPRSHGEKVDSFEEESGYGKKKEHDYNESEVNPKPEEHQHEEDFYGHPKEHDYNESQHEVFKEEHQHEEDTGYHLPKEHDYNESQHDEFNEEIQHEKESGYMQPKPGDRSFAAGGLVQRIMKKLHRQQLPTETDHGGSHYYECTDDWDYLDDRHAPDYNYTGANSGDELRSEGEDKRRHDIVAKIMRKMKKPHNPVPA